MEAVVVGGYVSFSIAVGVLAAYRGRSGLGWCLLALLISPLVSAIILALVPDLNVLEQQHEAARRQEEMAQAAVAAVKAQEALKVHGAELVQSLGQLRELHARSLLTEDEYLARKGKLLGGLEGKVLAGSPEEFLSGLLPLVDGGVLSADETARLKAFALADPPHAAARQSSVGAAAPENPPCPHCGAPLLFGATRCMKCWKKAA